MKKNFIILLLFLTLSLLTSHSSLCSVSGEGGGDFLRKGIGARPLAMGMAYVAVCDDATATYWNPAGLGILKGKHLTSMRTTMFDVKYNSIVYAQKIKNGGIGIFWLNADSEPIEGYDKNMNPTGTFSYKADAYYLSYGQEIAKSFYAGVSLKYITQELYDTSGDGVGFDLGLLYKYNGHLTIGLNLQDITQTKIKWEKSQKVAGSVGAEDKIHTNMKLGFSCKYEILNKPLILAVDLNKTKNRKKMYHLGVEYQLNEVILLRLGLDDGEFTAGIGLKYNKFLLDYSFNQHTLGDTNRVSLGFNF